MIRNIMRNALAGSLLLVAGLVPAASASTLVSLQDWCVNTNGDTADWCNVGSAIGVSAGFDYTLGSQTEGNPSVAYAGPGVYNDANTLGAYSATFGAGLQYVSMYMDYDLNVNGAESGSNQDVATVHGSPAAGITYEADDPNSSNIFSDFASGALTGQNNVSTYAPDGGCCDVSWALGAALNVAANQQALVTFTVSTVAPETGFYIQQTNGIDDSQNIYYSASVTYQDIGSSTPEPASWLLIGGGLALAFLLRGRLARTQGNPA